MTETKKKVAKAPKKVASKKLVVDKQMKELEDAARQEKYSNQVYPAGAEIVIDGGLWSTIVAQHAKEVGVLDNILTSLESIHKAIGQLQHNNNVLTVAFMENHMRLVDSGVTVPATKEEDASNNK
jgi:hypothetical protein